MRWTVRKGMRRLPAQSCMPPAAVRRPATAVREMLVHTKSVNSSRRSLHNCKCCRHAANSQTLDQKLHVICLLLGGLMSRHI